MLNNNHKDCLYWSLGLLIIAIISLFSRPLFPLDETRYVAVAWEMWQHQHFLVPTLNGLPYSHKPPLLFWLIHAGWSLWGVNTWWPRLLPTLFTFGNMLMTAKLANLLWPEKSAVGSMANWLLIGCLSWLFYSTTLMFDMLVVFFTLLTLWSIVFYHQRPSWKFRLLIVISVCLGILSKGPVLLLFILPAPILLKRYELFMDIILGIVLVLAWALPAAQLGGETYRQAIFMGQSTSRFTSTAPHHHPFWWYLWLAPAMLTPWTLWPTAWHACKRHLLSDTGTRLLVLTSLFTLICFSLIGGKQPHYLLPLLPMACLILAKQLPESKIKQLKMITFTQWAILLIIFLGPIHYLSPQYDLNAMAKAIKQLENQNKAIAHVGKYHGQYHFLGRLAKPLTVVYPPELSTWCLAHPNGYLISYASGPPKHMVAWAQPYRGKWAIIEKTSLNCADLLRKNG